MAQIDKRSKQDILRELKKRAASYVPEWRFDPDQPDIAASLAIVYADMLHGTLKKLNGTPLKNKIEFFNMANASLLPAEPSEGYVTFTLASGDSEQTEVPAGTVLTAPSDEDETVRFETVDDLLVCPAQIEKIFCTDDSHDYIGQYESPREHELVLFSRSPENLQKHSMIISHPYIFNVGSGSRIRLHFYRRADIKVRKSLLESLADKSAAIIEYYAGESGFVKFGDAYVDGDSLVLVRGEKKPMPDADGNLAIRITATEIKRLSELAFVRVTAASEGEGVVCDSITDGNTELTREGFFPFGERFGLFNEVYLGADEALCKRGADITLSFDVKYHKIPLENPLPTEEITYKWIADRDDFKISREYEISITEVIWEYYNGYGWSRLFADDSYSDLFNIKQGVTEVYKSMTFRVPEDIEPTFAGASEHYFIRAKILKAENLYKMRGHYLSPSVRNLSFAYSYENGGRVLDSIVCENNSASVRFDPTFPPDGGFFPFVCTGVDKTAVYLGFDSPPENGPYRILWNIRENPSASVPKLKWEYYSKSGWIAFNLVDESQSFTRVGFTVFLDNHGFARVNLFGSDLYFIRIIDSTDSYKNGAYLPIVEQFCENAVRARNVNSREEEYLSMQVYRGNADLRLSNDSILSIEVTVDETASLSRAEADKLEADGKLIRESDPGSVSDRLLVRWDETDTFVGKDAGARLYTIERSQGILSFGDGSHGRIPPMSDSDNIRVVYTTGGGLQSNVPIGRISGLERSVGFVTGVKNPRKFSGGRDSETLGEAMLRSAAMIRTQGKAVSARDYEQLARLASRSILGVSCQPCMNPAGERENGAVTLVILKDSDAEFIKLRNEILSYMKPRIASQIAMQNKLYITEPELVKVNVRALIAVKDTGDIGRVRRDVAMKLDELFSTELAPGESLTAKLGRLPSEQQIRSCIMSIGRVERLSSIYISTYIAGAEGYTEIDSEKLSRHRFILPTRGTHDISITLA